MHLSVGCVSAGGACVSVAAVALLTSSSAACAAGGVCVLVAKRARCCARAVRRPLWASRGRTRGLKRIVREFPSSTRAAVPPRAFFTAVFAALAIVCCRGGWHESRALLDAVAIADAAVHVV